MTTIPEDSTPKALVLINDKRLISFCRSDNRKHVSKRSRHKKEPLDIPKSETKKG